MSTTQTTGNTYLINLCSGVYKHILINYFIMKTDALMNSNQNLEENSNTTENENLTTNTKIKTESNIEKDLNEKESAADIILRKLKKGKEETKNKDIEEEIKNNIENSEAKNSEIKEELENTKKIEKEIELESKEISGQVEDENEDERIEDTIDFSTFNMEELNSHLNNIIVNNKVTNNKKNVAEIIKTNFYKLHHAEIAKQKEEFLKNDGKEVDFKPLENKFENEFKQLFSLYKEKRAEINANIEKEKQTNLEAKYEIIKNIEDLINKQESLNETFNEFKDLQKKWQEIGLVPQAEVKKLWSSYNYQVEKFYDFVKINKDLRDLDFKKNLERKIKLCEQAEELLLEPKVVTAFKILQKLHSMWRDLGPVPSEKREELWDRFKAATTQININHQNYFENLKKEHENNFKAKTLLCEKIEEINLIEIDNHKEWVDNSKEIIELQRLWKLIGFAPKKDNNKIYSRFRKACDVFFNNKRNFYAKSREEEVENLQKKEELCLQAESMKESTDWKKTTDAFINLQKKWKTIGPVPRKDKDDIWKRFRNACDVFFDKKSEHFSSLDESQTENLKQKKELIQKIKEIELTDDKKANFQILNDIQKQWTEIGYVPFKNKDEIHKEYREELNKIFENLKLNELEKKELQFVNKIESIKNSANSSFKARNEREKIVFKIDKIKSDIILWENNIGFFAKSKNAESMINDFNKKIENAKDTVKSLKKQLRMFDEMI